MDMGYRVKSVTGTPDGQVSVKIGQSLDSEQQREIVDGLDWEKLRIQGLKFEPYDEAEAAKN
jgi:hypothetical protein